MNARPLIPLLLFITLFVEVTFAMLTEQQQAIEQSFWSRYSDVQYYPEYGGWYLLTSHQNNHKTYAMADNMGNILVSGAIDYKRYDGYIRFHLLDLSKKQLHDQWQLEMKEYESRYANYREIENEYEQKLNAYNLKLEVAKHHASELYEQEITTARRKVQAEHECQSSNSSSGGIFGGMLKAIGSVVVQAAATENIRYDAILKEILVREDLLTPPKKPYNPEPLKPEEPETGYYWQSFTYRQPCPYSEINYDGIAISDGYADVKLDGRYGLVNARLDEVIPCISKNKVYQTKLHENNILVSVNGKYGILSSITDQLILSCEYDELQYREGCFLCRRNNSWGVCSKNGAVLIPSIYSSIGLASNVFIATLSNGTSGLIAFNGQEVFPFVSFEIVELLPEFILIRDSQDRYGAINYQGKLIVPVKNKKDIVSRKVAAYGKKVDLTNENFTTLSNISDSYNAFIHRLNQSTTEFGKQLTESNHNVVGNSDVDIQIPTTSRIQENTFAVIIANKNYDEAPDVDFALNDGYFFKEYCVKTLGIPSENIRFKEDATYNNIREVVSWIREISNNKLYKDNARFVVYYSGHGVPDEMTKSMYLLPTDGVAMNIATTGYKVSDLFDALSETSSESVVFLDACFSGFTKSGSALASTKGVVKINTGIPKGNVVVFSASSSNEVAHQYEAKSHGLFTYYLLKKMQETKGDVSLGDLFQYIEKQVVRTSLTVIRKSQTPTVIAGTTVRMWEEKPL